ncbi:ornithine cyclodeaminase family protein [Acidilutibacter cellobiosedens]|uniref:Ornithine cyclodeaminase family protein n=1 Tax=Acidilutibacter cellobiosedens TaxID=2507161 RepID=A0A410QEA4_9FIRM|nr:ornithine cyclodeaminase family protein [Acidilutibacter cellobiosedens]MBE6083752.1 ornithine cyclodeaminase family protein [Tissierellaceae bacterium]QAT62305.1 ornithine cyclodeaminase family protein [Acidilutibacter cellobiosedens]
MLVLTKEDIQSIFSMRDAIEADKEALKLYSQGKSSVPLRTNIDIPEAEGQSLYMPAYVGGDNIKALGLKIVSVYPHNVERGLPNVPATMVVLDPQTGIVAAIMEGTFITQLRTGAIQGAATEILSNENSKIGALFGTGGQAQSQLEAMLTVRNLTEVRVFDINYEKALDFSKKMNEHFSNFGTRIIAVKNADEAVIDADIVTTVTTSKMPVFNGKLIKSGAHINGIGAYTPEMHELPPEIVLRANKVIFDTVSGVLSEAGDLISPLKDGIVTRDHYQGELGEVILGKIKGRENPNEITLFKTVGSAVLDVVVGEKIYKKAVETGIGKNVELS